MKNSKKTGEAQDVVNILAFENEKLEVPIFTQKNIFIQKTIELNQDIFNVPIRKDIVMLQHINQQKSGIYSHKTKTMGEVAGSGKKPFKQKGTGRARQGNKRANLYKGGAKAHGPKLRFVHKKTNKKLLIQAKKIALSAKLSEGNLKIIDKDLGKTNKNWLTINENNFRQVTIDEIINAKNVQITIQGLVCLEQYLWEQEFKLNNKLKYFDNDQKVLLNGFKIKLNKKQCILEKLPVKEEEQIQDRELRFDILKEYLERY